MWGSPWLAAVSSKLIIPYECPPLIVREFMQVEDVQVGYPFYYQSWNKSKWKSFNPYDFGVAAVGSDLVIPFECPPLIVREEIFCNVTIKEKNGLYGPAPLHKPVLLGLARCSTVKNENYLILSPLIEVILVVDHCQNAQITNFCFQSQWGKPFFIALFKFV